MSSVYLKTRVREICVEIELKEPGIKTRGLKLLQKISVGGFEALVDLIQHISGWMIRWSIYQ